MKTGKNSSLEKLGSLKKPFRVKTVIEEQSTYNTNNTSNPDNTSYRS